MKSMHARQQMQHMQNFHQAWKKPSLVALYSGCTFNFCVPVIFLPVNACYHIIYNHYVVSRTCGTDVCQDVSKMLHSCCSIWHIIYVLWKCLLWHLMECHLTSLKLKTSGDMHFLWQVMPFITIKGNNELCIITKFTSNTFCMLPKC